MEVTITVCDVCRDMERQTRRYQVIRPDDGRKGWTDRCDEHSTDLEAALAAHDGTPPRPGQRRRRPTQVVTLEEIEQLKRTQTQGH